MSTIEDRILWLDLETSGSADDSDILEVGVVLSDMECNEIDSLSLLVHPTSDHVMMDPIVFEMHTKNGLLADLNEKPTMTVAGAEQALLNFLTGHGIRRKDRIPLAGSGVSHFDRRYIRRDWPAFDKRLTYWAFDVGVVRRTMRLAGVPIEPPSDGLSHRAVEDAREHMNEYRLYLTMIATWQARDASDAYVRSIP